MFGKLRGVMGKIFTPIAKGLLTIGVTADMVTIFGTIGTIAISFTLITQGYFVVGAWIITGFVLLDSLDGTLARLSGSSGPWGAFLDSVCDRFADGALFISLTIYLWGHGEAWGQYAALVCLMLGAIVPYVRAKGESIGCEASGGIAERTDRLVITLTAIGFVGMSIIPLMVLEIVLWVLAAMSLYTAFYRIIKVRHQLLVTNRVQPGLHPGRPGAGPGSTEGAAAPGGTA